MSRANSTEALAAAIFNNPVIVGSIAANITPDPVLFCSLAMVNKTFNAAVTTDTVWAPLDIYNLKRGIYSDFMRRIPTYQGLMKACWSDVNLSELDLAILAGNRYAELGYYVCSENEPPYDALAPPDLSKWHGPDLSPIDLWYYTSKTQITPQHPGRQAWRPRRNLPNAPREWATYNFGDPLPHGLFLRANPTILAPENRILELMLDIDPCRFPRLSGWLRHNYLVCYKACLKRPENLAFAPAVYGDPIFALILIAASCRFGYSGEGFIDKNSAGPAILTKAFRDCPNTLIRICRVDEEIQGLHRTRELFETAARGHPEHVRLFPFKDKESYLLALEPGRPLLISTVRRDLKFLEECTDREVILKALKNYPETILVVPATFRSDAAILCSVLPRVNVEVFALLLAAPDFEVEPYREAATLAACMDSGYLDQIEYPVKDIFEEKRSNYAWMLVRVHKRPASYHLCSPDIQRKRGIFMTSMRANIRVKPRVQCPEDAWPLLLVKDLPTEAWVDEGVLELASSAFDMDSLPRVTDCFGCEEDYWFDSVYRWRPDEKWVRVLLDTGVDMGPGASQEDYSAVFREDLRQILRYRARAFHFFSDPGNAEFVKEHRFEIAFIERSRRAGLMGYTAVPGSSFQANWNELDRDSALRLYTKFPTLALSDCFGFMSEEFAVEAVKANGRVFPYLPLHYQGFESVRAAIGPFRDEIDEHMDFWPVAVYGNY